SHASRITRSTASTNSCRGSSLSNWLRQRNCCGRQDGTGYSLTNDPTLADAILDRLVHQAHKVALKGESMRKRTATDAKKRAS
ncbi:ATP-binding protein, partial [Cupriavidus taiwanensis]|uniref:ATP-binding protein n=1 Tax=Cupriavidus taiwanensis TaxID=164546 RepID=UPI0031778265